MRRHREMYELMCAVYRQDPAARVLRRGATARSHGGAEGREDQPID
jgi:Mlc titration factor MtfA (ptsG expression regulator)